MSALNGFWQQIDAQLDRIESEAPDTFAAVRSILLDPAYDAIVAGVNLNGEVGFGERTAFFAGSGGDRSLFSALSRVGWRRVWAEAGYYYVAQHATTGALLTYVEGDVIEGDQSIREGDADGDAEPPADSDADAAWDYLTENGIASEETLKITSAINGHSVGTYQSVLYAVTGYRTFAQIEGAAAA